MVDDGVQVEGQGLCDQVFVDGVGGDEETAKDEEERDGDQEAAGYGEAGPGPPRSRHCLPGDVAKEQAEGPCQDVDGAGSGVEAVVCDAAKPQTPCAGQHCRQGAGRNKDQAVDQQQQFRVSPGEGGGQEQDRDCQPPVFLCQGQDSVSTEEDDDRNHKADPKGNVESRARSHQVIGGDSRQ